MPVRLIWIWWMHSRRAGWWIVWWVTGSVPSVGKRLKRGLSAGRVQSAALRIIADREEEINAFVPEEYWSLDAQFKVTGEKEAGDGKILWNYQRKMEIHSREEMDQVLAALKNAAFSVTDVKKGERTKKAPLPFTTSTLQQEASKVLNFFYIKDHAAGSSSFTKELILRDRERLV